MTPIQQMLLGVGAKDKLYVDDVFSMQAYRGNATYPRVINNGIDLTEGGLVWWKCRSTAYGHQLIDTERGVSKHISTDGYGSETDGQNSKLASFNNNGFTMTSTSSTDAQNANNLTFVNYTFRKSPGFFDVVTYTGNGSAGRQIAHNIEGDVGCVMVKCTSNNFDWAVWHRYMNEGANVGQYLLYLNENNAESTNACWDNTSPTTSVFTVGDNDLTNGNGYTYVAYIFAQDGGANQRFGDNEDQGMIDCSEYDGNGNQDGPNINVGWEPQWLLIKRADQAENWFLYDSMRGVAYPQLNDFSLLVNGAAAESELERLEFHSTGFKIASASGEVNANGGRYLYIAIRRPDGTCGRPPEVGTDVFDMDYWVSDSTHSDDPNMLSNFPVDLVLDRDVVATGLSWQSDWNVRARGYQYQFLKTNETSQSNSGTWGFFDYSTGWMNRQGETGYSDWHSWMWKRGHTLDILMYKGNGSARNIKHWLGVAPEMVWSKRLEAADHWAVYHKGLNGGTNPWTRYLKLNTGGAEVDSEDDLWFEHTSTHLKLGNQGNGVDYNNGNGKYYVSILFASKAGISKVGSYTGNVSATGPTISLGFAPRFIILKCASAPNDWSVYDTSRGNLGSGDEKRLALNTNAGPVTSNDITPSSTGFQIVSSADIINENNQNFIYYAHA